MYNTKVHKLYPFINYNTVALTLHTTNAQKINDRIRHTDKMT